MASKLSPYWPSATDHDSEDNRLGLINILCKERRLILRIGANQRVCQQLRVALEAALTKSSDLQSDLAEFRCRFAFDTRHKPAVFERTLFWSTLIAGRKPRPGLGRYQQQWSAYINTWHADATLRDDPIKFWTNYHHRFSELAEKALDSLLLPTLSIAAQRSFAMMHICATYLRPRRRSQLLEKELIEIFNQQIDKFNCL